MAQSQYYWDTLATRGVQIQNPSWSKIGLFIDSLRKGFMTQLSVMLQAVACGKEDEVAVKHD